MNNQIINNAANLLGLSYEDLISQSRKSSLVKARGFICYYLRSKGGITLGRLANLINRDHTTVINYLEKISYQLVTYGDVRIEYDQFCRDMSLFCPISIGDNVEELLRRCEKNDTTGIALRNLFAYLAVNYSPEIGGVSISANKPIIEIIDLNVY